MASVQMALTPIPGFIQGSNVSRSRGASYERTVNMRVEKSSSPNALAPFILHPRSGRKTFATLPNRTVGFWASKNQVFIVNGTSALELLEDGSTRLLGEVAIASNPATMKANGSQLLICIAGNVYLATGTAFYQPIINFANGFVDVAGVNVTWRSGDLFTGTGGGIQSGNYFQIGDLRYIVDTVIDNKNLTVIPDPDTGAPGTFVNVDYQAGSELLTGVMPEFIDGYFIVNVPNTKQFRISALGDGKRWDAIDIGQKSGSIDNIGAIKNLGGNLALFGDTNSTEQWADSGNSDFPFSRISGNNLNVGIDAAWSVVILADGSICGLLYSDSGDGVIGRSSGGPPVRISNDAIENAMRRYGVLNDAIASTYSENGNIYYRIDFPTANRTWEYNATTNTWAELGPLSPDDEVYAADLARYHVHVTWPTRGRMHLAADYSSGKIWEVSPDFTDDDGVDFPVMRIGPHIPGKWDAYTTMNEFALQCALGELDPTIEGPDGKAKIPTVEAFYSDDGAHLWKSAGPASVGRAGEYDGTFIDEAGSFDNTPSSQTNPQVFLALPVWHNLGAYLISRTMKVKSTGKMLRAIYGALAEVA